ncbi:MAG: glycosyltransferase family 4 protein [Bernardetiaceae bacterium]|nr:glycosyltransferase family 4 protein [Bernardetiaceae bacterium]
MRLQTNPLYCMRIGYEAKRVFHNKTGLGNYSRDLIRIMSYYYPYNQYLLYNPKPAKEQVFEPDGKKVLEKLPQSKWDIKFYNLWRQFRMVEDLKADGIEIFHGLSGELPNGLAAAGIKSIVTIHDLIFLRYPSFYPFLDRKISYYKFKKAAQEADIIVAISEQTKRDIVNFLSADADKIKVIYQGCRADFQRLYDDAEKRLNYEKYGLPSRYLLYVSRIEKRKNLLGILKAIASSGWHLAVVGGGSGVYYQEVMQFIEENNLKNRIHFLKDVPAKDLAMLYQSAEVFLYPSFFEGFGIPIVEGLYSKTPVITSVGGVFPEAGGEHAMYVKPEKPQEIREAIDFLTLNPDVAAQKAEAGYEFVQKFNDAQIAADWAEVYGLN